MLCLLKGLDRAQFDPVIVCPQELIDLVSDELKQYNVRRYPVCIRRWTHLKEIKKFLHILKQEKPDIVHSHLLFATMFAAPLSKWAKVPKVIDTAHIREAWRKGIKKAYFIDRFFYSFVDEIIAVSDAIKKYLIEEKKLPATKIAVVKNGVDLTRFQAPKIASAQGDKRTGEHVNLGTNQSKLKIGVIGRLEEQKGHRYFLKAVNLLGDTADEAEFLIIGQGSLQKELQESAQTLGIDDKIKFLGYRRDIVAVLNSLDILVLPSLFEGLPLVALEASALGKAVIVTDVDGSPEAVAHEHTGLVVPAKGSGALKDAMARLIDNRQLITEYGKNAKKYIETNFDIKKQVTETEEIYKRAISCKS